MTGYGAETIAAAPFPEVRIFQKPLERETLREFFVTNAPDFAAAKMPAFAQQSGHAGSGG
jgi:hypothetical protein